MTDRPGWSKPSGADSTYGPLHAGSGRAAEGHTVVVAAHTGFRSLREVGDEEKKNTWRLVVQTWHCPDGVFVVIWASHRDVMTISS